jgi:D-sedoheptulose 7-phosphate isomerase
MGNKITTENYFKKLNEVIETLDFEIVDELAEKIEDTIRKGNAVYTCGNGGSAQTASHMVTDWAKMFNIEHKLPARVFSLVDNKGLITAYGNDIDYSKIFSEQLSCYAESGDLLLVISGSGNSPNILEAINYANENNIDVFSILGYDGGKAKDLSKNSFVVPSFDMQICEDIHMSICHVVMKKICQYEIK